MAIDTTKPVVLNIQEKMNLLSILCHVISTSDIVNKSDNIADILRRNAISKAEEVIDSIILEKFTTQ